MIALVLSAPGSLLGVRAQPPGAPHDVNRFVEQLVDSRRGYVVRVPGEAVLDSGSSGWNVEGRFERRVYVIPHTGIVRITATVRPPAIPDSARQSGPYRYADADSATPAGVARIRTYFLASRSVRIELIPTGHKMHSVIGASDKIFLTFRWKPGAETDAVDTDPPSGGDVPGARDPEKSSLGGD